MPILENLSGLQREDREGQSEKERLIKVLRAQRRSSLKRIWGTYTVDIQSIYIDTSVSAIFISRLVGQGSGGGALVRQ